MRRRAKIISLQRFACNPGSHWPRPDLLLSWLAESLQDSWTICLSFSKLVATAFQLYACVFNVVCQMVKMQRHYHIVIFMKHFWLKILVCRRLKLPVSHTRLQIIMTLTLFQTMHGINSPIGRKSGQYWGKRRRTCLLTSIFFLPLLFPKCSHHISHKWKRVNGLNLKAVGMMECNWNSLDKQCYMFAIDINSHWTYWLDFNPYQPLTHYHTIPYFDALKTYSCRKHCDKRRKVKKGKIYKAVENFVTKREIACNKQFLLSSQCFLPYIVIVFHFK